MAASSAAPQAAGVSSAPHRPAALASSGISVGPSDFLVEAGAKTSAPQGPLSLSCAAASEELRLEQDYVPASLSSSTSGAF